MFQEISFAVYLSIDQFLIFFFRIIDQPMGGFLLGSASLAFMCVIVGELSVSLALKLNKPYIDMLGKEMRNKEQLSMIAHCFKDKTSYKALNKEATDAWGKHFFTMVAYSAGFLWPIPMALGWMQTRFGDVQFPLAYPLSLVFGETVGHSFAFIPIYILCRILFKYIRPFLPYFKGVQKLLDSHDTPRQSGTL